GLPLTSGQTVANIINTGTGSQPASFIFNSTGDVCYIADGRAIASGGGIQKWTLSGGVWSLAYTLGTGAGSTVGAFGVAVDFSASTPIIYATTTETTANRLIRIDDTGAGSAAVVLATAGANTIYRGVAMAPAQSCPAFTGAPANVSIVNSFCNSSCTVSGGTISAPSGTPCPSGSSIQYQVDGGSWTTVVPVYNQTGPAQTIKTRCSCDLNTTVTSPESAPVTTVPGVCLTPTQPVITITDNICPSTTGTISGSGCGTGTVLEWATNPAGPWSGIVPSYLPTPLTVFARCRDNATNCTSTIASATTNPVSCAPACPVFTGAPSNVSITNSSCVSGCTVSGGVITAPLSPCPSGSTVQYQVNGGAWTTTLPVYAQTGPAQSIKTRCSCDTDNTNVSAESSVITTVPGVCTNPLATLTALPATILVGGSVSLTVPSAGAGASYNWSGNGVVNTNANSTTAIPVIAGVQNYFVTVTNSSGCSSTGSASVIVTTPVVNLSVSTSTASEAAATTVTVTATASSAVTGNQSVSLGVSGAGITATDYDLSGTTITILNGQTTGSVIFTVVDDVTPEGNETAVFTISNPTANISLGTVTIQNVLVQDNTCSFVNKVGGALSTNGAEIPAFDPVSKRVYTVAGSVIEYFTMSNSGSLTNGGTLPVGFTPPAGTTAVPNSVAISNGIVAAAYAVVNNTTAAQLQGQVVFYNASTGAVLNSVQVGFLPDMVTFTPNGLKVLTANEGEPNSYGQGTSFDPEGSVSIIDISSGVGSATVQTASFTSYNSQLASLRAAGVRIYGPGATVAQDLEPEYIAITPDGNTAWVTLQENNAHAVIDIATATVTSIRSFGLKNHNTPGNGMDASDRDLTSSTGRINIANWPVFGMYMPDAIGQYSVGGQNYFVTANEGDSRAWTGYSEEVRVGASNYLLDPATFPNAATLKLNGNLGRLQLSNATGDLDGDGDIDQIHALGARSFSIWNSSGSRVFDSGDQLEQITALRRPGIFNSEGAVATFDTRSDNKGPEPEGVAIGVINNRTYAFIGIERIGDVIVYDITDPVSPSFVQYINVPEDLAVEGLVFVAASNSPTGKPLLITAAEVSLTVSVYEINIPAVNFAVTETSGLLNNDGITCSGALVTIAATGGTSYQWSNGSNNAVISVSPVSTTTYTVTATNAAGCTATSSVTITVNPLPAPTVSVSETSGATPNDGIICSGATASLTATGGNSYLWSTGATTATISVTPAATTTYTVTVTNANNCSATATRVITVNPLPTTFAVTGGGGYCIGTDPGTKVGLSGSQTGISYQLQLNGVNTGAPLAGTGNALDFGFRAAIGTYTVVALNGATNCSGTMTGSVSVFSFNCSVSISDPCVCLNNATSLTNGQFGEQVKVNAPSNQTWTVSAINGLFSPLSPAPPSAPSPITVGTVLTGIGGNMFTLDGRHIDALGYTVSVTNGIGTTLSIGNSCSYPNPAITSNLAGPFCLSSDAVALTGNPGDANIVSQTFRVNGVITNTFDPSAGVGSYVIEYTVNGGTPKANGANDPGCIQSVSQTVQVLATPAVLTCNDLIYLSLDADCSATIGGDDVLEGSYGCYDDYLVELDRTLPYGNGPWTSATVTSADLGKTYQYRVTHLISGNRCWGD
ncbi:MAG: choice-of-anchor I family protein, partial [Bacteroidota bacterium]